MGLPNLTMVSCVPSGPAVRHSESPLSPTGAPTDSGGGWETWARWCRDGGKTQTLNMSEQEFDLLIVQSSLYSINDRLHAYS